MLYKKEDPLKIRVEFINVEKEVQSAEEALQGAQDIIAEMVSDEAAYRSWIRNVTFRKGVMSSSVKDEEKDEKNIYEMYYSYEEPLQKVVPHRVLAMNRGEKEDILRVAVVPPVDEIVTFLNKKVIRDNDSKSAHYVQLAIEDGYKRLIQSSIEREIRKELTETAEEQAIHIFSENLRNLLLQPPMKGKVVLAVDPAYRTGCKLSVVDDTGKVHIDVIYPHPPVRKYEDAKTKVLSIIDKYQVEMIAIGNGTASRETEEFIVDVLQSVNRDVFYIIVNEAGASVYSASDLAREEFPNLQVEERSAVSIGRRLQDPLAELVKIDPKSVGVGQYQHDVSQKRLNESLTFVVETAVNQVGVNVNTAFGCIVTICFRFIENCCEKYCSKERRRWKFTKRTELKKIPRLGAKTYEQCIGFLRILEGANPLDRTGIHPEQYKNVELLLKSLGLSIDDVGQPQLQKRLEEVEISKLSQETGVGEPTLVDIIDALISPERDMRDELPKPLLKKGF